MKLKRQKEEPDPGRADRAESPAQAAEEVELDGPDMCEDYDDVGSHGKSDQESEADGDGEKAVDKQKEPSGVVTSAATASASGKSGRSGGDDSSDDSDDDHDAGGRPSGRPGVGAAQEKSIGHREANHSWGSFRITIRPPTGGPRSHGSWFARCPYHKVGKTWCNRTSTMRGPSEQDSKIALRILYEWCNRARGWTRKRDHMAWPPCDPNDLPDDEILCAQLPRPLDPDECILSDYELDMTELPSRRGDSRRSRSAEHGHVEPAEAEPTVAAPVAAAEPAGVDIAEPNGSSGSGKSGSSSDSSRDSSSDSSTSSCSKAPAAKVAAAPPAAKAAPPAAKAAAASSSATAEFQSGRGRGRGGRGSGSSGRGRGRGKGRGVSIADIDVESNVSQDDKRRRTS